MSDLTPSNDRIPSPPRRSKNATTNAAAALVSLSIATEYSPTDSAFQPPRIVSPVEQTIIETVDDGNESSDDDIPQTEKEKPPAKAQSRRKRKCNSQLGLGKRWRFTQTSINDY